MIKRIALIFLVLLMLGTGTMAFAKTGLGVAAGAPIGGNLPGTNTMLSLKIDSVPLLLGIGVRVRNDNFNIGITADNWIANNNLIDFLNWYIGVGGYVGLGIGGNASIDAGIRIPIGLNTFLLDRVLELFLEVAPTIGVALPLDFPTWGFQSAFGFRIWF